MYVKGGREGGREGGGEGGKRERWREVEERDGEERKRERERDATETAAALLAAETERNGPALSISLGKRPRAVGGAARSARRGRVSATGREKAQWREETRAAPAVGRPGRRRARSRQPQVRGAVCTRPHV